MFVLAAKLRRSVVPRLLTPPEVASHCCDVVDATGPVLDSVMCSVSVGRGVWVWLSCPLSRRGGGGGRLPTDCASVLGYQLHHAPDEAMIPPAPLPPQLTVVAVLVFAVVLAVLVVLAKMPSSKLQVIAPPKLSKIPVKAAALPRSSPKPTEVVWPKRRVEPAKKSIGKEKPPEDTVIKFNASDDKPLKGSKDKLSREVKTNSPEEKSRVGPPKMEQQPKSSPLAGEYSSIPKSICDRVTLLNNCRAQSGSSPTNRKMRPCEESEAGTLKSVSRLVPALGRRVSGIVPTVPITVPTAPVEVPNSRVLQCLAVVSRAYRAYSTPSLIIGAFCVNTGKQISDRRFRTECQLGVRDLFGTLVGFDGATSPGMAAATRGTNDSPPPPPLLMTLRCFSSITVKHLGADKTIVNWFKLVNSPSQAVGGGCARARAFMVHRTGYAQAALFAVCAYYFTRHGNLTVIYDVGVRTRGVYQFLAPSGYVYLSQRDEKLADRVVHFQAHCRGYLARKRFAKRKVEQLAVRCIQRNVRKFLSVRNWPWWRLLVRVMPLLNVHRTEEELRAKTEELDNLKNKFEKLEQEKCMLKLETSKLEAKIQGLQIE
ncbi:hypothetical protein J6590_043678 [Homalodisca vitripennis]|nr:hypothetical protein J6590_043678 [Homalodisca vitripennis]